MFRCMRIDLVEMGFEVTESTSKLLEVVCLVVWW